MNIHRLAFIFGYILSIFCGCPYMFSLYSRQRLPQHKEFLSALSAVHPRVCNPSLREAGTPFSRVFINCECCKQELCLPYEMLGPIFDFFLEVKPEFFIQFGKMKSRIDAVTSSRLTPVTWGVGGPATKGLPSDICARHVRL